MRATLLNAPAAVAAVGRIWWDSRLPSTYNVMEFGSHDFGGGAVPAGQHTGALTGCRTPITDSSSPNQASTHGLHVLPPARLTVGRTTTVSVVS